MGRFETELLATNDNLAALADLSGIWIYRVHDRNPPKIIVLDMDSSVRPTHGDQEGTAYNGHFGCTCYHPLPDAVEQWSLTSLREKLIKIGAKIVRHGPLSHLPDGRPDGRGRHPG